MEKESLRRKRLMLAAIMFASIGSATASGPAIAQQAPAKWKPGMESITISTAPLKNWRELFTGSRIAGSFFAVSASIAVPYSDLDLAKAPGAAELGRRINLAARLVCEQLDVKYLRRGDIYPIVQGDDDCEQNAAEEGHSKATEVITAAKR